MFSSKQNEFVISIPKGSIKRRPRLLGDFILQSRFQFQKVRLKDKLKQNTNQSKHEFQFQKVRLKGSMSISLINSIIISIP